MDALVKITAYALRGNVYYGTLNSDSRSLFASQTADLPADWDCRRDWDHACTLLPLFITPDDIIRLLSSGSAATIIPRRDISKEYASSLDKLAHALHRNAVGAVDLATAQGQVIVALREEAFAAFWKAAVIRAGLLSRWEVVLSRE